MKAVSLVLKIVAILAAAFCAYAWMDTRGKVSSAENHLKGIEGENLEARASKIPEILKNRADLDKKVKAFTERVRKLEKDNGDMTSELETERSKNVQANADLVKKNSEIRSLNASIEGSKKQVAQKDTLIESLKREIVAAKSVLTQNNEADSLKERVASLEQQLNDKNAALEEANKKAKLLEMSEIVEVVETDAQGNKVIKKIVKTPYIPTGDIATVLSVSQPDAIVAINRGADNGVKADQKILLKREGVLVSEIMITEVSKDSAIGMINREVAIPETIEVGDLLELAAPSATTVAPAAPAVAPAADTNA